jgi:hypothetical protein
VEEFAETLKERETRKIWMSIILKWISKKYNLIGRTRFIRLRNAGCCERGNESSGKINR